MRTNNMQIRLTHTLQDTASGQALIKIIVTRFSLLSHIKTAKMRNKTSTKKKERRNNFHRTYCTCVAV